MSRRRRSSYVKTLESRARPVPSFSSNGLWIVPLLVGIAAVSLVGIKSCQRVLAGPDRGQAVLHAQEAVKEYFEVGTAIRFAPELTRVEQADGGLKISGWVEAITPDGKVSQGYDYNCAVKQNLIGNWSVKNLNLLPK